VLAIPISTVASECAFSTGGRVVNPYRSCLTPKIVEVLVCTQDWLRGTPFSILFNEDLKSLMNLSKVSLYENFIYFLVDIFKFILSFQK